MQRFSSGFMAAAIVALITTGAAAQDVVTKQYEDGGIYEGTFKDGKITRVTTYYNLQDWIRQVS